MREVIEESCRELPKVRDDGQAGMTFTWPSYGVIVDAERVACEGEAIRADLTFWLDRGDDKPEPGPRSRISLLSASSKAALRRELERAWEDAQDLPFDWMLMCVTHAIVNKVRAGEPVQEIWACEDDILTPSYLLEPILPHNHPTVIFGDYGSLKSLLALAIGYIVQLPHPENGLDLTTLGNSTCSLFLDYEDDSSSFRKRWSGIERGFGIGAAMPMLYQRMTSTISESLEQLQRVIADKKVGLLIVDSLGPAARGNLNDPEPAIKYHAALRQLGVTSLTLAHNSKDQVTKKRTIFGSIFFTNLARSVWECRAETEPGEDEAIVSLKHVKANLSRLHPPLGFTFRFTDDSITVSKSDLRDTGLSGELPPSWQLKNLLKQGACWDYDLVEQTGSKLSTVQRNLRRWRTRGEVVRLEDGKWEWTA